MKFLIIFIITFSLTSQAQIENGIIKYTAEMNIKHRKDFIEDIKEKDIDMNTKQSVIQMYKNAEPDYYELHFTEDKSYYFKDKSLENEQYNLGSKAGLAPYYYNLTAKQLVEDSRSFGYVAHKPLDWEIANETKMIGDFKCYKATTTETLYSRQGHYYDREVVAWFTPDIPYKYGPKNYVGLPGLVLQVERKEFTITATKINLNPDGDKLKIKRVGKDEKVISHEEMTKRIAEKMKDYNKR
ncbi:GLPGLI family protein [Psychroflexus sp. MES1-P1E]|uniref:GLPGLI family protein n=1 Tax=Psychroflexus sp. MES1-P1E TaxID=2058320 RepID=UPI0015E131B3|nr:GLPGLI family protein [Psychroflexus sp. MES1-P1E]